jgi:hypothetical protein
LTAALKEAAINQVFSAAFDEKTGAGHTTRGAKTGDLHSGPSFPDIGSRFADMCFGYPIAGLKRIDFHCLPFGHNRQYI